MDNSIYLLALPIALLAHSAGAAQDKPAPNLDGRPQIMANLYNCREIAEPAQRLACFDREVAAVERAEDSKELVIAGREQVREARRGLFGLSLPRIGLFSDDEDKPEIKRIETTLQSASPGAAGRWIFVLEDGARWVQTDSTPVLGRPGTGDPIIIERAAFGSYMASVNGKRSIRVKRFE